MKHILMLKKTLLLALVAISVQSFSQTIPPIGTIPAGDSIIIVYDVTINAGTSSISNQGSISGSNFATFNTNDPKTVAAGDATITLVNAAPVVTTSGGTTAFVTQTAAVIDAGLTVTDANNTTLASATVSITGAFQTGEDVLAFTNNNATTFGNIAAVYNASTGTLTLTSAGATATVAQWQAALRAVTYSNTSAAPNTTNRTVSFVANDGSDNSNAATKTVSISRTSSVGDYYRSLITGNWNSASTWQSSPDNVSWYAATLTPDFNANTITIQNAHTVTVTAGITVDQTVVNAGGSIVINTGNTLNIVDGTGADIVVNGSVTVSSGGSMILKSTATGTASIGTSGGSVTGNVTVERYIGIPASKRAWRLLTAPLKGASGTFAANWQSNFGSAGIGTNISGPTGTGFDYATPGYSLKRYDIATQKYVAVTNTGDNLFTSAASAANLPYMIFVAGDKTLNISSNSGSNNTTLRAVGALQIGTQAFSQAMTANQFMPVGNPYASPVNFKNVGLSNAVNRFYTWDPNLNTFGGYVLVDDALNTGTYTVTPSTGTSQDQNIQSGQAFFVQAPATASTTVTFTEASKSNTTINNVFRTGNGSNEQLRINLELINADNTTTTADGVFADYNNLYSSTTDYMDAYKMTNDNENLSIINNRQSLMLERRPLLDNGDTIKLNLTKTTARNYRFSITPTNMSASTLSAFLEDSYLKTSTPVSLSDVTNIPFSVNSDAASAVADRFQIVFKSGSVLPINFTSVKAIEKNKQVQVEWTVATETNTSRYEVEKSLDGRGFTKAASVNARGNNSVTNYNWTDVNATEGNNYYRIKSISKTGEATYSGIVNVKIGKGNSLIVAYPNPVKDGKLSLQLSNVAKGTYTIRMFNHIGQEVFNKTIEHMGGSSTQTIQLRNVVKGVYQLQVSNSVMVVNQQLICY